MTRETAPQEEFAYLARHEEETASDLETRLEGRPHQSLRLWLRMLSCTVLIQDEIRSRLRNQFNTTLPRFDLMSQLERYPEGLRMGELSRRMMVTNGNITGITNQLEQEDLVMRVPDPDDGRAYTVRLTPSGRQLFERMAVEHETWVEELLGGLAAAEQLHLGELLSRIKRFQGRSGTKEMES
jgi:DNA-binding MarR family transcriptional regulator